MHTSSSAEALWRARLDRFYAGGTSAAEFCRREGVSQPSFYEWKRKLAESGRPRSAPTFVPVRLVENHGGVEIVLLSGVRLFVPDATSPARVRQLALALADLDRGAVSC